MVNCHNCKHEKVCIFHCTQPDIRSCPDYIPKEVHINIDISAFDTVPKDYALKKYTKPHRIIVNYPATIVFWKDGTKTVVKCAAGTDPDLYSAFCAAVCKKVFGSNSHLKKVIEEAYAREKK